MADATCRTQPAFARNNRRHQLICVQAAFHQYFGLAFSDKRDSFCCRRMAMRHVDDFEIAEIDPCGGCGLRDLGSRSNQQWHDQSVARGLDCPCQSRRFTRMGHCSWNRRQAFAPRQKSFVFSRSSC